MAPWRFGFRAFRLLLAILSPFYCSIRQRLSGHYGQDISFPNLQWFVQQDEGATEAHSDSEYRRCSFSP